MFRVEFAVPTKPDRRWLSSVLYSAVAHGVRYNAGSFDGSYRVIPSDPADEVVDSTSDGIDHSERFADAVETYCSFDAQSTELAFSTTYTESEPDLPCFIQLLPHDSRHLLSFGTNMSDIVDSATLQSFIELPKAIFERFEFIYGASRLAEQEYVPVTKDEAYTDQPRTVTFYPPNIADEIGRKKLRSAPAAVVEELDNGGIYVLASSSLAANREEIQELRQYLQN